jgi:hypothetical protein
MIWLSVLLACNTPHYYGKTVCFNGIKHVKEGIQMRLIKNFDDREFDDSKSICKKYKGKIYGKGLSKQCLVTIEEFLLDNNVIDSFSTYSQEFSIGPYTEATTCFVIER